MSNAHIYSFQGCARALIHEALSLKYVDTIMNRYWAVLAENNVVCSSMIFGNMVFTRPKQK